MTLVGGFQAGTYENLSDCPWQSQISWHYFFAEAVLDLADTRNGYLLVYLVYMEQTLTAW